MAFKQPTTQDILDLIREQKEAGVGFNTPEELDKAVSQITEPFDMDKLSPTERDLLEGNTTGTKEEAEVKIDTPMPDDFNLPSTSDDLDFTMDFTDLGVVPVDDMERDLYIKSLLNDTPFRIPVEVFPGFNVVIQSRTVYFDDLVYDIVRNYSEKGEILGLESGFTRLMRLLAGVQVVSIQGRNTEFVYDKTQSRKEVAMALKKHVANIYDDFSLAKWNAVVKAVRVFDAKQKICNDKVLDRTFWEGANIS